MLRPDDEEETLVVELDRDVAAVEITNDTEETSEERVDGMSDEGEEDAEAESLGLFLIGDKFAGEEVPIDRHDNDLKNDASVVDAAAVTETAVEEE